MPPALSLTIPADAAQLRVLRTTVAAAAAAVGMTLDQVDDVRLAVEEAAAQLLHAGAAAITTTIPALDTPLALTVSAVTTRPLEIRQGSLPWIVLEALTTELAVGLDGEAVEVTMTFASAPAHAESGTTA